MTTTVEAIYEQGVLRLAQPIQLAEGTKVEVIVIAPEPERQTPSPSAILTEIAALPLEQEGRPFAGRDHDKILYGGKDAQ